MLLTGISSPDFPNNSNLVNVSFLKEFQNSKPFRSFSIKYVVEGDEIYTVNGKKHLVQNKQYLLANSHSEGDVIVDSKTTVKGICIDVSPSIISEATIGFTDPTILNADIKLDTFLNSTSFFENVYSSNKTYLGNYLEKNENLIIESHFENTSLSNEFYYELADRIIKDHIPIVKQLQNIKVAKTETRKMILYKLLCCKEIMDSSFLQKKYMADIASEVGFSEYHFFRLFKSVFGISPNQYLINKRMNYAMALLLKGHSSISDLALECSFPDSFSFSKSFKKHFGKSPSQLLNVNSRF